MSTPGPCFRMRVAGIARSWRVLAVRSAVCLLAVLSPGACHRGRQQPGERSASTSADAPTVSAMSPDTLQLRDGEPAELTIRGRGFVADSNTVHVGPVTLYGLRSGGDGTILRFIVPDRVPSGGEAPPSLWVSGTYRVVVENAFGRSADQHVFIREHR